MKHLFLLVTIVVLAAAAQLTLAGGFPKRVHYVGHDAAAAAFVKGGRIIEDEGLVVVANRGSQREAELHAKTNHVFIIVDGEAEFVTGGTIVNGKEISPGQTRGPQIKGGQAHHLSKGDVITVPAGTAHQWTDTSKTGSVAYYAVNFEP